MSELLPQQFPFRMVAGTSLESRLDARCWGLYVSNYTAQWVEIPEANEFVPPNTRQVIALPGVLTAKARFASPPGVTQPLAVATQAAILTYTERVVQPSGGVVGATALPAVTQIERFTKGSLPAAGTAGRLVLLTDYDRGIWKDTGTNFVSLEGEVFNVKQFGAIGDGVTDDQAAITAAIAAMVATTNGGVLLFPPGTYLTSVTPTITDPGQTKKFLVWAYGAQIKTTGGIRGFAVSNAGDAFAAIVICGLTINHQNNATALDGILLEQAGHVSLRDVTVLTGGNTATYAGIHARNLTATSNATGCPWGHMLDCTVRRVSGGDVVSAFGVILEGGANSWRIQGGLIEADVGVLIRNQSAASNTDPNSVTLIGVDITGTTACVKLDDTGKLNTTTSALVRVINCRAEAAGATFFIAAGMVLNNAITEWAPLLVDNNLVSITTYVTAPAGIVVVALDWGNTIGNATSAFKARVCRQRYIVNATVNATNAAAGTYVDLGAPFTITVDALPGDQVAVRLQSVIRKLVGGSASAVIDRGGTKLPAVGASSSVTVAAIGTVFPFLLEVWDAVAAAGTYTYKPQVWTDDNNTASIGLTVNCQFVVEVWR